MIRSNGPDGLAEVPRGSGEPGANPWGGDNTVLTLGVAVPAMQSRVDAGAQPVSAASGRSARLGSAGPLVVPWGIRMESGDVLWPRQTGGVLTPVSDLIELEERKAD
jgi:hypothetical protein